MLIPTKNCPLCPRLKEYRNKYKLLEPAWHNSPVPSFGEINSKILIVGLAPGLKGANKTGRPFTGDHAGKLLYPTLIRNNLAKGKYKESLNDGIILKNTRITNSVRCVPPKNKPINIEKDACRIFLQNEINSMKYLKIILALGTIAHQEILKVFRLKLSLYKFQHGKVYNINKRINLYDSYHCSRYNTQTNRLTESMFNNIIQSISKNI